MNALLAFQYLVNKAHGYAKEFGYVRNSPPVITEFENRGSLKVRKLGNGVGFSLGCAATIRVLAARVFCARNPFEIFRTIIQSLAVQVIDRRVIKRGASVKRLAHESMHEGAGMALAIPHRVVAGLRDFPLENATDNLTATPWASECPNAPQTRRLETGVAWNRLPNFVQSSICGLSHIASPTSVVVRPARCATTVAGRLFPSRFTLRSQLRRAP